MGLGCLLVFGSYISLLFHGNNQLWGTLLVAAIGLLMYFSDTREQEIKDTSRAKKEAAKRQARLEEAEKNRLAEASAEQESREQEKQKELAAIERQKADLVSTPTLKQSSSITEAEAQRKAIQLYPELGIAGSQLNRDFVARYKLYKQTQPTFSEILPGHFALFENLLNHLNLNERSAYALHAASTKRTMNCGEHSVEDADGRFLTGSAEG